MFSRRHEHLDVVAGRNTFVPVGPLGHWVRFSANPDSGVIAGLRNAASGAADTTLAARKLAAQYLWPLSTRYNRHFRGVISIKGRVAVSGVVRGRVTLFASGNIIIVDDLSHANPPDSVPCPAGDALGLASSGSIYMADNVLNVPEPWGPSGEYRSYAAGSHRGLVQATLLTLGSFWVENYAGGAKAFRQCDGVPTGRGCLYLTGGRIQQALGAIGTTSGTGYVKRFRYDRCAAEPPPPHFPTTGRFFGNRREDVGADGFDPARYFRAQAPR